MSKLFVNTIQPNSGDTVTISGSLLTTGKLTIGDSGSDTVAITAEVSSSIIPDAHNTYNLGSLSPLQYWKDLYVMGITTSNISTTNLGSDVNSVNFAYFDVVSAAMLAGKGQLSGGTVSMSAHFHPISNSTLDLGSSGKQWKDLHVGGMAYINTASIVTASINVVSSSLLPHKDDHYDLGHTDFQWKNLFIDGTANIDTLAGVGSAIITNITSSGVITASRVNANVFNINKFTAASQDLNSSENYTVNGNKVEVRAILKDNVADGGFAKFSLLNSSIATDSVVLGSFTGGTAGLITGSIITAATIGATTASVQIHNETGAQINADTSFTASFVVL